MNTPSPFEALIGSQLSAVVFVQDYVQLQFDGPVITVLTPLSVSRGSRTSTFPGAGSRDALCSVIGKRVVKQSLSELDALTLEFEDGAIIRVPLDFEARTGPEAMNYVDLNDQVVVW